MKTKASMAGAAIRSLLQLSSLDGGSMAKVTAFVLAIMGAIPLSVNASMLRAGEHRDLKLFVQNIMKTGDKGGIDAVVAKPLGLAGDQPTKFEGTDPEEAADGLDRACHVVIEQTKKGPKPVCLIVIARDIKGISVTEWFIRLTLDGTAEAINEAHGLNNADGSAVKGSGVGKDRYIDPASKQGEKLVRRELDYWLHNRYRTELGKLRLTNPNATMADVKAAEARAREEGGSGGGAAAGKSAADSQAR